MIPEGFKFEKPKHTPYNCANCTYHKYGKDIKISEFVNAGRENTEVKKIIGKTVSIQDLKKMCKEIPEQKEIVNMNIDPYMANRVMKTAKISHDKIIKVKAEAEAKAKTEADAAKKQEQPKGGNANE